MRGLTRSGSTKGTGSSFRGSLKDVMEDAEAEMGDNDWNSTSSESGVSGFNSTSADTGGSSGGRRLPVRHLPRSQSARSVGATTPLRRLTRSFSSKGAVSFRGSLENVLEDTDSDASDDSDDEESGEKAVRQAPPRRMPAKFSATRRASLDKVSEDAALRLSALAANETALPARHLPRMGLVASRGSSFRTKSLRSIHLYGSQSSLSSASVLTNDFTVESSVNMMDFGVSQRGFAESSRSIVSEFDDNLSIFVDDDGFLAWGREGATSSSLSSSSIRRRQHKRSSSADDVSVYSSLVDSDGFLGWNNSSRSLVAGPVPKGGNTHVRSNSADSVNVCEYSSLVDVDGFQGWSNSMRGSCGGFASSFIVDDKELVTRGGVCSTVNKALASEVEPAGSNVKSDEVTPEKVKDESSKFYESWRIEDYEGDDTFDDQEPQRTGAFA